MNKTIITGNVGHTPEIKVSKNNEEFITFSVGVRTRKDDTQWFNCTAMGKTKDVIKQYVHKGDKVLLEGAVSTRAYLAKDGTPKADLSLFVSSVELLSSKPLEHHNKTNDIDPAIDCDVPF